MAASTRVELARVERGARSSLDEPRGRAAATTTTRTAGGPWRRTCATSGASRAARRPGASRAWRARPLRTRRRTATASGHRTDDGARGASAAATRAAAAGRARAAHAELPHARAARHRRGDPHLRRHRAEHRVELRVARRRGMAGGGRPRARPRCTRPCGTRSAASRARTLARPDEPPAGRPLEATSLAVPGGPLRPPPPRRGSAWTRETPRAAAGERGGRTRRATRRGEGRSGTGHV